MTAQIKQRIIGGLVLLALLAIFLPLFFNNPHPSAGLVKNAPGSPAQPTVELALPQQDSIPQQATNDALPLDQSDMASVALNNQAMADQGRRQAEAAPKAAAVDTVSPAEPVVKAEVKAVAPAPAKPVVAKIKAPKKQAAKSVPVKQAYQQLLNSKAWVVQLASFGSKANAKRLVAELRGKGYQAYQRSVMRSNGNRIHQVFVGPEINRERTEALKQTLSKQFHLNGLVRRYSA